MNMPLKKQEIIDEAYRHFYEGGFQAMGVDRLMADRGISKRTFYKYFPTKDSLIETVLEKYLSEVEGRLFEAAADTGLPARDQIRKVFEIRRDMFNGADPGCLAIRARQEFGTRNEAVNRLSARITGILHHGFATLALAAGLADPVVKARTLCLLFQGAIVSTQMRADRTAFDDALGAVDLLIGT